MRMFRSVEYLMDAERALDLPAGTAKWLTVADFANRSLRMVFDHAMWAHKVRACWPTRSPHALLCRTICPSFEPLAPNTHAPIRRGVIQPRTHIRPHDMIQRYFHHRTIYPTRPSKMMPCHHFSLISPHLPSPPPPLPPSNHHHHHHHPQNLSRFYLS